MFFPLDWMRGKEGFCLSFSCCATQNPTSLRSGVYPSAGHCAWGLSADRAVGLRFGAVLSVCPTFVLPLNCSGDDFGLEGPIFVVPGRVQLRGAWPRLGQWQETVGRARSSPLARHRSLAEPPLPPPLLPCYFHRIVRRRGRMFPAFFLFASKGRGEGRGFCWLLLVQ